MKIRLYKIFRLALLAGIMLCAGHFRSAAQQYPVRVQVQLMQPVSPQLTNLYSGTQARMIVTLLNSDLQKPSLSVRLRMTIKGGNVVLRNRDYGYYPTLQLDAGIPLRLSLDDLAPYFQAGNLDASGIAPAQLIQNAHLPDGYYTICVEVIEVNSGQVISNSSTGCSPPAWISTSQPPLLNLPMKGYGVAFRDPLNITFNWTPRHMNSANAAFQTEYEFTLSELWDTLIAPEAAFLNTPPLYQTVVSTTTMLYGPAQPPLIPGKRYAWRVKAKAKVGIDEYDVFLNNGYSEIFWFVLQEDCQPPQQVLATVEKNIATITWLPQPKMSEYIVEYREANKEGAEWFNVKTTDDHVAIYDAVPGRSYEYRVGGYCVAETQTMGDLHGFKMPAKDSTVNKSCGLLPDIKLANQTPITALKNGDQIMAGDFPVRLMTVAGNGTFKGTGYVMVPFLSDAKIKVRFDNIQVNTNRQLMGGMIQTTFDSTESQVANVRDVVKAVTDFGSVINDLAHLTIDVDYLIVKDMADSIRKIAEAELPQELKDRAINAADKLEDAKKQYDEAKAAYDSAATSEEKAAAKEKMDSAKQEFEDAKKEVEAIEKEKKALVDAVTDLLIKAVRKLKKEYTNERKKQATDKLSKSGNDLEENIRAAEKLLVNGIADVSENGTRSMSVVISIDSADVAGMEDAEFYKMSAAFKEAEFERNKITAVDILDRDISNREYYDAVLRVFKVNGKNIVDFINEEKKSGRTEDEIVDGLKVKMEELIIGLLLKR